MKLPWAQKRMLWPFEKSIFQVFAIFWVTKLKPFDGNVTQSVQISLNQSLLVVSFLENGFEATLGSKKMLWVFEKGIFQFFGNFWVTKLKPFPGKARQSVQDCLNQNLVVGISKKMVLKLPWAQTRMYWAFEKSIFQFFANLFCRIWYPLLEKLRKAFEAV